MSTSESTKVSGRTWRRRTALVLLGAALALVLAGVAAPFINAARFSGKIQRQLEAALGRKVEFEKANFTLFSGPGFSLANVTIGEDPRYGLEAFAFVPTLEARLRVDKLLLGQVRFTSLRLEDASLNLVKRDDGTWNVVELIDRLSTPRRAPLNLFPAFEISDGRVNFKLGTRKTVLYISDSDLSIYPQRSGKVYLRFSGSPARTDRAGVGFGHFRGSVNWFLPSSGVRTNQLEAEVTLDPSNLSELTTLVEGHDVGVHGTVSSFLRVAGPADALELSGILKLRDVHRWDLIAASGEDWSVRYAGGLNLLSHQIDLKTVSPQSGTAPVSMHLHVNEFLSNPEWSIVSELRQAPLAKLMPLAARMGIPVPPGAKFRGEVTGAIGYSNTGASRGAFTVSDAEAALLDTAPLRAAAVNVSVSKDTISFDPSFLETETGKLQFSGEYDFASGQGSAQLGASGVSIGDVAAKLKPWLRAPPALKSFTSGLITGQFSFSHSAVRPAGQETPLSWSGAFDFIGAELTVPGLAVPLRQAQGRVIFDDANFDLDRFAADVNGQPVHASYHYRAAARRPERLHLELVSADLSDLGAAFAPVFEPGNFLARLRLARRSVPPWLKARNMDGDLLVRHLSLQGKPLGPLTSHFRWQGTDLELDDLVLKLAGGQMSGGGTVNLTSYAPRWRLTGRVAGLNWKDGVLNAEGDLDTTGLGEDSIRNLKAQGSFEVADVNLSATDAFDRVSGQFDLSLPDGWPDLRLSNLEALQDQDRWTGEAASQKDGKLLIDLQRSGRQLRIVSTLDGDSLSNASGAVSSLAAH